MARFVAVDAPLISLWAQQVLNPTRPLLRVPGVRPTEQERAAIGAGFAALRAAVLGEHVEQPSPGAEQAVGRALDAAADVERYLVGTAAGIEATGADRDPISLVAGLIAGAAAVQFSTAGRVGDESSAAEFAARAGVAAADLAADGADLARIVEAAAAVANSGWVLSDAPQERQTPSSRLRSLIGMVLAALARVVGAADAEVESAGCGAGPGEHGGRRFLAEITFEFRADAATRSRLAQTLTTIGTDLRVWPQQDHHRFHLHSVYPAQVIDEIYALGTPFDLRIGTLEPALSAGPGTMDGEPGSAAPI